MVKDTGSQRATPSMSTGTPRVSPNGEESGPAIQISKADWTHERIARRAYELYEERGRQDGQALEDWMTAEQQLVGAAGK
jgi:hypothetical protein